MTNEMYLHLTGHLRGHPRSIDSQIGTFMNDRNWSTPHTLYTADNQSDRSPDNKKGKKLYPLSFSLGLDHVPATNKDWFSDVKAIIEFFHPIAKQSNSTFLLQFRLKSKPAYFITIQTIDQKEIDATDLTAIKLILENEITTHQKRPWWRK